MKRLTMIFFTMILLVTTTACGGNILNGDDTNKKEPKQEEKKEVKSETTEGTDDDNDDEMITEIDAKDVKEKMDKLAFFNIDIEVSYAEDKEYEAKIKQKENDQYKAELEDDLTNNHVKGKKAFDEVYPMVEKLDITSDSSEQEVIDQILTAFDLPTDYETMDVEIHFHDDKRLDFEHRK